MISRTSLAVIWPFFCALISRPDCFHCAPIGFGQCGKTGLPIQRKLRAKQQPKAKGGGHCLPTDEKCQPIFRKIYYIRWTPFIRWRKGRAKSRVS
jgi:hypothetical protein